MQRRVEQEYLAAFRDGSPAAGAEAWDTSRQAVGTRKEATMNIPIEPVAEGETRKELKKQLVAAACGLAITIAAMAGIGAWQVSQQSGATNKTYQSAVTVGQAATGVSEQLRSSPAPIWYLVSSQQEADRIESNLGPAQAVVVVNSPQDEARLQEAVSYVEIFAASFGKEGPRLVDLRPLEGSGHDFDATPPQ
jgi:hypothetical protein